MTGTASTGLPVEGTMPLLEHLREARTRLLWVAKAAVPAVALGFWSSDHVFAFLCAPMNQALATTGKGTLAVVQATEGFMVQMKVALLVAAFALTPVIAWHIWAFVAPGLYAHERRTVLPLAFFSTMLFLAGSVFCYLTIFTYGFPLFLEMNGEGVQAVISIDSYLSLCTTMLLSFGVAFQLPIGCWFAARMGWVDGRDLMHGFRYAIVAIFVVSAILTPSPDALSQFLMALPLTLLYGIGVGVAALSTTKVRAPVATDTGA
jgi:sec-independent protein translocase protein TatC